MTPKRKIKNKRVKIGKSKKNGLPPFNSNINDPNNYDIRKEIPKQIITGNICPCNPDGKGKYFIAQKKILDTAKYLNINPDSIPQEAWSEKEGKFFISWKGFYKLPESIQAHWKELEFKKGLGYGIKTGKQQDGRFIIVFDCDNDKNRALEYMNFLRSIYGDTFIRETPSNGFHLFYESPDEGILKKDNMHIDLRHYISHNGLKNKKGKYTNVLDMEIKQGSFIRENGTPKNGKNYSTYMDLPIKKLNPEIDLLKAIQRTYPNSIQIKDFTENGTSTPYKNKESLKVLDNELLDILNTKYLPSYISTELNGHRDNLIIPATFGFLIKRNMPRQQMESVLDWINNVAENKKQGTPNKRNYNFDNIPDVLSGSGILRKHGFDEFVDAINSLDPEHKYDVAKNRLDKILANEPNNNPTITDNLRIRILTSLMEHKEPNGKILSDFITTILDLYKNFETRKYYERTDNGNIAEIDDVRIIEVCNNEFGANLISNNKIEAVLGHISNPITKDYDLIEFNNGILNTKTRKFNTDKTKYDKIPKMVLGFNWNPEAPKGMIGKLLDQTLDHPDHPNDKERYLRAVGHAFMGVNRLGKLTLIQGQPNTGKSTLSSLKKRIFNYSTLATNIINANEQFTLYAMIDKDVNIDDDINNGILKSIGTLNTIVTGNGLEVQLKHEKRTLIAENQQIPRLFANGNTLPPVLGEGFDRRLLLIHAKNEIDYNERDTYLQTDIEQGKYDQNGVEWFVYTVINTYWDKIDEPITTKEEEAQMKEDWEYKSFPLLRAIKDLFTSDYCGLENIPIRDVNMYIKAWFIHGYEKGLVSVEHKTPDVRQISKTMNKQGHHSRIFKEGEYPDYTSIRKYEDTVLKNEWENILESIVKKLKERVNNKQRELETK